MKRGFDPAFIPWRFYLLLIAILVVIAALFLRVIDLTFIKKNFLREQGNERVIRTVDIPAFRGMITDRNGFPLAISTSVYSVWINPKEFVVSYANLKPLAQHLLLKTKTVQMIVKEAHKKDRGFIYLKRNISPQLAEKIKSLKLPGVYLQQSFRRFYPAGEVTAHVLGFTNIDDQGQEGIELAYDQWLSGVPGKKLVIKDRLGREMNVLQKLREQKPGNDLRLSIDHRVQYLAYRELMAGVHKNIAESGSVVVLDAKTGEILAMVNQPSFNPNSHNIKRVDAMRNRAVTDVFEPGSTIKAFSIATALESGRYSPNTVINTYPGWMRVERHLVRDDHSKGPMTVAEIMQISSNVGVTKMILSLPSHRLWELLHKVGFGESTGINFPGERSGVLAKRTTWSPFALATLAFGYGLSATTLQLAQAYNIIANGGEKKPLSLLHTDQSPKTQQVMNPHLAKQMLELLESVVVVKGATGELAKIPGYRVAGKTGTSKKVGEKGYESHNYISSFVGIAPVSDPRLVVAVVINNPQGKDYYASMVSAPVFKNIMEGALRILNVKPDNVGSHV